MDLRTFREYGLQAHIIAPKVYPIFHLVGEAFEELAKLEKGDSTELSRIQEVQQVLTCGLVMQDEALKELIELHQLKTISDKNLSKASGFLDANKDEIWNLQERLIRLLYSRGRNQSEISAAIEAIWREEEWLFKPLKNRDAHDLRESFRTQLRSIYQRLTDLR